MRLRVDEFTLRNATDYYGDRRAGGSITTPDTQRSISEHAWFSELGTNMYASHLANSVLALALVALSPEAVLGQGYPNKPIRIVTSDAGGGSDIVVRIIAQAVSGPLGQQIVVDNRGGGVIAGEI